MFKSLFQQARYDLPASLVVFLVAVPLCLGIALASGAPLFSGIIAGIIGGVMVGAISGSSLGVSGPAAGLAIIVANAIKDLGTQADGTFDMQSGFAIFLGAVVIGGVLQIALAFARAGIIGYFFPNSVIKGMLSAIGLLIILKQIPHALGHDIIAEGFEEFFQSDGENTFTEVWAALGDINPAAVIITVVSMGILLFWELPFMKKQRIFQLIQGPLVVVAAGVGFHYLFLSSSAFQLHADEMVKIPLMSESGGFVNLFTTPDFSHIFDWNVLVIGVTIAIVASLETLLCVEATDKIDPEKGTTPTNRELLAQGVGNIASGLIGGLPVTQVIVRSSANIQSGGKTKLSAIIHGVLIALSVFLIPDIMNMIPLSSLAAILFMVGYKLAKPSLFASMYRKGNAQFIPFVVTIVGIIFSDLLIGIGIGLAVTIFMILYKNYSVPFNFDARREQGNRIVIRLSENVTFLNKASIKQALDSLPDGQVVEIDATKSHYIHPDVVEIIEEFQEQCVKRGITCSVKGDFDEIAGLKMHTFLEDISEGPVSRKSYWWQVFNT